MATVKIENPQGEGEVLSVTVRYRGVGSAQVRRLEPGESTSFSAPERIAEMYFEVEPCSA